MENTNTLLAGALDQFLRYALSGCGHAAHQASRLLEAISERPELDQETRRLCSLMCDRLESQPGGWMGEGHV